MKSIVSDLSQLPSLYNGIKTEAALVEVHLFTSVWLAQLHYDSMHLGSNIRSETIRNIIYSYETVYMRTV